MIFEKGNSLKTQRVSKYSRHKDGKEVSLDCLSFNSQNHNPSESARHLIISELKEIIDHIFTSVDSNSKDKCAKIVRGRRIIKTLCSEGLSYWICAHLTDRIPQLIEAICQHNIKELQTATESVCQVSARQWTQFSDAVKQLCDLLSFYDATYPPSEGMTSTVDFCLDTYMASLANKPFLQHLQKLSKELLALERERRLGILIKIVNQHLGVNGGEKMLDHCQFDAVGICTSMLLDLKMFEAHIQDPLLAACVKDCQDIFRILSSDKRLTPSQRSSILLELVVEFILAEMEHNEHFYHQRLGMSSVLTFLNQLAQSGRLNAVELIEVALVDTGAELLKYLLVLYLSSFLCPTYSQKLQDLWDVTTKRLTKAMIDGLYDTDNSQLRLRDAEVMQACVALHERLIDVASTAFNASPYFASSHLADAHPHSPLTHVDGAIYALIKIKLGLGIKHNDKTLRDQSEWYSRMARDSYAAVLTGNPQFSEELSKALVRQVIRICESSDGQDSTHVSFAKIVDIFRALAPKDLIKIHFETGFIKGLFITRSINLALLKSFVSRLIGECGTEFTAHMTTIIREYEKCAQLNDECHKTLNPVKISPHMDEINLITIEKRLWVTAGFSGKAGIPKSSSVDVNDNTTLRWTPPDIKIPKLIMSICDSLHRTYHRLRENTILDFQLSQSSGIVHYRIRQVNPNAPVSFHRLEASAYQILVLLTFNDGLDQINFDHLERIFHSETPERLHTIIESLTTSKFPLLIAQPDRGVSLNREFVHDSIAINLIALLASSSQNTEEDARAALRADEHSMEALEAFIVCYMKRERKCTLQELELAVRREPRPIANVRSALIRERVNVMVKRDYISLDTKDPSVLHYEI